jgi:hypothetical protein
MLRNAIVRGYQTRIDYPKPPAEPVVSSLKLSQKFPATA